MRLVKTKGWHYGLVVIGIILCIMGGMFWKQTHLVKTSAAMNIPLVRTATVSRGELAPEYTYAGEVRGRYESQLAFQVGGKIIKRSVDVGAVVQAGQVLMQLDSKDFQQRTNRDSAQLIAAQAQLKLAENNLSRYQQLYAQAAISQAQLDQYQNSYDLALAGVRQALAQEAQGANSLGYTLLIADRPGVVASLRAEVGQVVNGGQTVLTMVLDGEREIEISVPENRLEEIRQATQCQVTFWALPKVMVLGNIREIAPIASSVTRTYKVRIALVQLPPEVKLGMTATVMIGTASQQVSAIMISPSALYQTGDTPSVWVVKDNMVSRRAVTIGVGGNDTIQVLAGLTPGETIVTAGVHKLQEGQQIRVAVGDQP